MNKFETALQGLREGKMITRQDWQGMGFVFRQVPSEVPPAIIPRMTSLPASVKAFIAADASRASLSYKNQLAIVTQNEDASTLYVQSWNPTVGDLFAEDWLVLGEAEVAARGLVVAGETVGTATPLEK